MDEQETESIEAKNEEDQYLYEDFEFEVDDEEVKLFN